MTQIVAIDQSFTSLTKPEAFFSLLYGAYMIERPKRFRSKLSASNNNDRQWVFVGGKERMKSLASKATLFAVLSDPEVETTYYTPNGYYRRDLRWTESLRWLNAFVFDLDIIGETIVEVLERFDNAGLPRPTSIIKTPSGGYHATYVFSKPVRATTKAIRLYTAIMGHMAVDLGSDTAAVGANRIFRTPTEQNLIYFEPSNCYDFEVFKTWRDINHPYEPDNAGFFNIHTGNIMNHPALQYLLESPCQEGRREQTALTLALAMKASDWPQERAEAALRDWFISCCSKGAQAGKKPFTQRDAVYKAGYVFRSPKFHAPKADVIRELSGLPFFYQTRNCWESAKPRSDRERSHLFEWEADLLALLKTEKELSGTQQELATRLNCPLTSFKAILCRLRADGRVIVETRRGRGGLTVVRLPEPPLNEPASDNVIVFPLAEATPSVPIRDAEIIHADFQLKRVTRIDRLPAAEVSEPEAPDPEPPD
ncbi:replication initiation protein [Paenibacillus prosopidis]|uniref:Replicase family protein n=1 Tax=Paenibacillus prosopidis TaxID=630520 RepID=A0A368VJP2_9BACL|nr:replication initiation protein [Paenibacillus prosopidis]RCW41632.1 replicase family protein [Paenibacillus prosopidis]